MHEHRQFIQETIENRQREDHHRQAEKDTLKNVIRSARDEFRRNRKNRRNQ
jgi:septal ring factor EnvC (AmiA/AmiB activator)